MYAPLKSFIDPAFVLMAENSGGQLVGYIFATPDLPEAQQLGRINTLIVKTLAVLPDRRCAGLGGTLLEQAHLAAHAAGLTRAIHALMYEGNRSLNLSRRYATRFRSYELFRKTLRP